MNTKFWIGVAVVALVAVALYMGYDRKERDAVVDGERVMAPKWVFTEQPEKAGIPQTKVAVAIGDKTYEVGTFDGTCSKVEPKDENEIAAALCWFAGGGKEIGVFMENDGTLVIKTGDVDEGDAETAGFRGNFKTVLEL